MRKLKKHLGALSGRVLAVVLMATGVVGMAQAQTTAQAPQKSVKVASASAGQLANGGSQTRYRLVKATTSTAMVGSTADKLMTEHGLVMRSKLTKDGKPTTALNKAGRPVKTTPKAKVATRRKANAVIADLHVGDTVINIQSQENGRSDASAYDIYSFVAPKTATYIIYTSGSEDTYCALIDSDGKIQGYDDDGGDEGNFLYTLEAEEGETYYIGVRTYSGYECQGITLTVVNEDDVAYCETPTLVVNDGVLTVFCATEGATISYSFIQSEDYGETVASNEMKLPIPGFSLVARRDGYRGASMTYFLYELDLNGPDTNQDGVVTLGDLVKVINELSGKEK